MARPHKTGLDYFPLDTDLFADEKIVCIAGKHGIAGQIIVISLLCAIYRNGYYIEWNEMIQYRLLRDLPGISAQTLNEVVESLVNWGFFDRNLFRSHSVLTSRGIQSRYFEITKKRIHRTSLPYIIPSEETTVSEKETSVSDEEIEKTSLSNQESKSSPILEKNNRKEQEKRVSAKETQVSSAETQVYEESTPQSKVNKIKLNKTPPISPTGGSEGETKKDFSVFIDMLKSNVTWRKAISASHSIPTADIPVLLHSFRLWIISIGEESSIRTLADAKRRFSYWLKNNTKGNANTSASPKNIRDRMRKEEEIRKQKQEQERIEREKTDGYCLHRKYGYPFDIPIGKVMSEEWRQANPPESFR